MNNDEIIKSVKRDYSKKIQGRYDISSDDINGFISLMNYCFLTKNSFFIENFNTKTTKNIYLFYNQLKSNILNPYNKDLLENVPANSLKSMKFILTNFVSKYDDIITKDKIVVEFCNKQQIRKIIETINNHF